MTESQVTTIFLNSLKKHGFFYKASDKFQSGIPDIIGCYMGLFVSIEMKIDSGKPTPLQSHVMKKIDKEKGFTAVVTYSNKGRTYKYRNQLLSKTVAIETIIKDLENKLINED